jgi:hypothetical protein
MHSHPKTINQKKENYTIFSKTLHIKDYEIPMLKKNPQLAKNLEKFGCFCDNCVS